MTRERGCSNSVDQLFLGNGNVTFSRGMLFIEGKLNTTEGRLYFTNGELHSFGRTLITRKFDDPVIWIGLYIALATLYFVVTICADLLRSYVRNRAWYPSRYFSINAASITMLGIALKIPTDLTMEMPSLLDQLCKLSGSVLLCTVMAISMPTLGTMDRSELISNVAALAVLVITLVVDVCIQIYTGCIYVMIGEHVLVLVVMLLLLAFMVSTSMTVQTIKEELERELQERSYDLTSLEIEWDDRHDDRMQVDGIKERIAKYWLLAHTSNPQFVIGRTATSIASTILCTIAASTLIEATIFYDYFDKFCDGQSEYEGMIWAVFITQFVMIIAGSIGPTTRFIWWSRKGFNYAFGNGVSVEEYWVKSLKDMKESPLRFFHHSKRRWWTNIARCIRSISFAALISLQTRVVQLSKLIRLVSVIPIALIEKWTPNCVIGTLLLMVSPMFIAFIRTPNENSYQVLSSPPVIVMAVAVIILCLCCLKYVKYRSTQRCVQLDPGTLEGTAFVLHLEGESDFVDFLMRSGRKDSEAWIKKANKKKNAKLLQLINRSTHLHGFTGVTSFDARLSSSQQPGSIQYCWALPVVTLACVALALPQPEGDNQLASLDDLLEAIREGYKYARLVDRCLDDRGLSNMIVAAEFVFEGLDLDRKWFDVDLPRLKLIQGGNASETIAELGRIASCRLVEFYSGMQRESTGRLKPLETMPPKVLAADCLLRTCSTILLHYDRYQTTQSLFEWLNATIADILGACLTNLPQVIHMKCSSTAIEVREESVRKVALLFGEVEELLRLLYDDPTKTSRYSEIKKYMEQWRTRSPSVAPSLIVDTCTGEC